MLHPTFEHFLRKVVRRVGLDLHRYHPERSESHRLVTMLAVHDVDVILDVGANTGQFALSMREAGYRSRLVSFEPLSTAHEQLLRNSRGDPRWEVAPRVAIGDHEGEIELYVAGNSVSSSALAMLQYHVDAAPDSVYVSRERVRLSRLDTMASEYWHPGDVPFLKIDTQGYEDRVLNGATNVLERVRGLQLEASLVPLYDGQQLFDVLIERLRLLGFTIWAIWPGFHDPQSGRTLQVDITFFRK